MKRILLLTAIAVSALTACQKAETTISFDITDFPEGTIIEIVKWDGDSGNTVYKDTATNGIFCYTYTCDTIFETTSYSIFLHKGNLNNSRRIYIKEKSNTEISGSGFYTQNWSIDSKNPRQQFENQKNDVTKDIIIEIEKLSAETYDEEKTKEERLEVVEKYRKALIKYKESQMVVLETLPIDEYWLEEFANATGAINIIDSDSTTYPKLTKLYNRLSDADKATPIGKRITLNLFGKTLGVGDKIVDYDLYDADGNIHHLAEYQGKWLLLDFASYHCGPCRMFAATAKYYYERGIGNNFEIITMTDDTKRVFDNMVATEKYVSPLWNDHDGKNGIFALYKIPGYPTFYLVSPDGTITDTWLGFDQKRTADIIIAHAQPEPEFKTENGVSTITNPTFSSNNGVFFVDKVELYNDSTVLNCTYAGAGSYCISSDSYLNINGKRVSTITKSDIEMDKFIQVPVGKVGHCRLTFEPLPKNATEFDFIESDCDGCFRVLGIKVKE